MRKSDKKKYKSYDMVPFKKPVSETVYQQVRRSKNPVDKADELGILDRKKLKKFLGLLSLEVMIIMMYFIRWFN